MATEFIDQLLLPENFYWAWRKAKQFYNAFDTWYDEIAIADFELNLAEEIESIRNDFVSGDYKLAPINLLPQPKSVKGEAGAVNRQAFSISVRDQVAWLACINVIGPLLDTHMPSWSYGHRLYRPAWYENEGTRKKFCIGPYRHSKGLIYRRFHHSWPLYRRHIYLTVKKMSGTEDHFSEQDLEVLERESSLIEGYRLPYLQQEFWSNTVNEVYWASIDCKTFYPSIHLDAVKKTILKYLQAKISVVPNEFIKLLDNLLSFRVSFSDLNPKDVEKIEPKTVEGPFDGLPTNLMVAGFLSNIALLDIDLALAKLAKDKRVAHFRFVDDHTILTNNFDTLIEWVEGYQKLLKEHDFGVELNAKKHQPGALATYLNSGLNDPILKQAAKDACKLNPLFPTPLMTKTLEQVSILARRDFDLLSDQEQTKRLDDIEHLLLTDFPEAEMPERTRISFAASRLATLTPKKRFSIEDLLKIERELVAIEGKNGAAGRVKELKTAKDLAAKKIQKIQKETYAKSFILLLEALERHPEKLRLLERALIFCENTGFDGLGKIIGWLERVRAANPIAARFLASKILQILGKQAVRCACKVTSDSYLFRERIAALKYLECIFNLNAAELIKAHPRYFERQSAHLFQCGLGTALEIHKTSIDRIKDDFSRGNLISEDASKLTNKKIHKRKRDIIKWWDPTEWAKETGISLATWIWWSENAVSEKDHECTNIVWETARNHLDARDKKTGLILRKHVGAIPEKFENYILTSNSFTEEDGGWICDYLATKPIEEREAIFKRKTSGILQKVGKALNYSNAHTDKITLYDWIRFCSGELAQNNPFDPRLSEWTALEITLQVIKCLNRLDPKRKKRFIHPLNFILPASYKHAEYEQGGYKRHWNWENWRYFLQQESNRIEMVDDDNAINDYRLFNPRSEDSVEQTRAENAALALLLLCLIKHNLSFPTIWNLPYHQKAYIDLAADDLKNVPCSSWTTAIFEACLMPRAWETQIFKFLGATSLLSGVATPNDVALDPPDIITTDDFKIAIQSSQEVLRKNQVTILEHQPRQLTPINIRQLGRNAWTDAQEERDVIN